MPGDHSPPGKAPSGPPPQLVPIDAQIACVRREIEMRKIVYGRRVVEKRMTQKTADSELAAMHAVLRTLESIEEKERLL